MSKRFYPTQDFVHAKRQRRPPPWPWYALASIILLAVLWVASDMDWRGKTSMRSLPARKPIASTETNSDLASIAPADTNQYVLSVSVGTNAETSANSIPEEVPELAIEIERTLPVAELPTVTLFNGCGVKGVGKRASAALVKMGFEILEVRNARSFEYQTSEVLDRHEDRVFGRQLADSLGIPAGLAAWDTTRSDGKSDVTLIVGADYKKLRWKL